MTRRNLELGLRIPGWILFAACVLILSVRLLQPGDPSLAFLAFMGFLLLLAVALFASASKAERIAAMFERLVMSWRGFRQTGQFRAVEPPQESGPDA